MKKTALVLSGGGSRGAYEIGVWKALKELNIKMTIASKGWMLILQKDNQSRYILGNIHDFDVNSPKAVTRMMLRTLVSTTIRIFLPIAILFGIGLAIDLNTPSKPWGMAIGTGIGIIIAAILVATQLKTIHQDNSLASSTAQARREED